MKHPLEYKKLFPQKKFGQNFLVSVSAIESIVDHAVIDSEDIVLEIGPGLGALTEQICRRAGKTIVIEKDKNLVNHLTKEFNEYILNEKLEIIEQDAVYSDFDKILGGSRFKVVSNLPYNVSIPILFNLYGLKSKIDLMTLMFQKEVADRLVASPGKRKYGVVSVNAQLHADIYEVLNLTPGDFFPSPKVYSTVLNFSFLEKTRIDVCDNDLFQLILKSAFFRKRRTLRNSMESSHAFPVVNISEMIRIIGVDPQKRAEDIEFHEWKKIFDFLYPLYRDGVI